MADLTLRLIKGSPVTFEEMDSNLLALDSDSPFKVSAGHITYQGKVGIGYGVDSLYRPEYHLDFGIGDSNQQVLIGAHADVQWHQDSATDFAIWSDASERFVISGQTGNIGIGIPVPNQALDVAGNIQSTATVIGNQGFFTSMYDGFMTIVGGSIFNGVNADMSGTVTFGQLSDGANGMVAFEIDELSGSTVILPASSAIKFSLDSEVNVLNIAIDSDHQWANQYIGDVDSDARARDDSDRADLINQIDSDHAWANNYINNVDSDARARDDSEHAWALSQFNSIDSALDSEHAWNVAEHAQLQANIDSEHLYALGQSNLLNARADSEHAWANANFDSEHAWNVASHAQLQANIDSDHLWANRNFDSDHAWAVNNFDSEHFWAKAYIEAGDSVVDSELKKQIRIQNALNDSEHAWNVAEHGQLQQNIDSTKDYADRVVDSDHAWAVSELDSLWQAVLRIDSDNDEDRAARFDSEHAWNVSEHTQLRTEIDSDHNWAVTQFANQQSLIDSALDSEHAWNVAEHAQLQANIDSEHTYTLSQVNLLNDRVDSEHAWNVTEHASLKSDIDSNRAAVDARIDSDHLWAVRNFDSDHAWAVNNFDSEHFWAKAYVEAGDSVVDSELKKQIRIQNALNDSEHAWNVAEHGELQQIIDSRADSEHAWNIQEHNALQANIDSDHAWANTYISNVDSDSRARDDSDHTWANNYFTQIQNKLDSEHAYAVSENDSGHQRMLRNDDSDHQWANTNFSNVDSRLDSEHAWNVVEHAKIDSRLDSEHAWNVAEHDALQVDIDSVYNALLNQVAAAYTSNDFDSDFALKTTDSLSEGTTNLYYTTARADSDAKRAVSGGNGIDYDNSTGVIRTDSQANVVFNDLILTGDLTVSGGQTIISTQNLNVSDTRITLNDSSTGVPVNDVGFIFERGNESNATFFWDESEDKFTLGLTSDSGKEDGDINVTVGTLVANIEGNVTGQVSDISNHTTDQLAEGATNLYYTTARADSDAKNAISATAPVTYDNTTGVITIPAGNLGILTINGVAFDPVLDSDYSFSYARSTDSLPEGTTNLYYTQARAQTDFDSGLATKTTDDVTEGTTNLYYTQTRAKADFDSGLASKTLDDIAEGATNLYYTQGRAQTDFDSGLATKTTDNLTEGSTNLYYTQSRAQTDFDSGLATKTTDNLTEGATNLYYTQARAQTDFDSGLATKTTTDLTEGTNLYYTTSRFDSDLLAKGITGGSLSNTDSLAEGTTNLYYTQARAQTDFDSGLATKTTDNLTEGTTNLYYTQARAQTDFDSGLATKTTSDLAEGTNLYYTTARADSDAKKAISATAPVTYDNTTGVITIPSGNLGILTLNGVAFDPVLDSDRAFNFAPRSLNNTDSLPEGSTNLYYTQSRAQTDFDSGLATKTTDNLAEGATNLYYTQSRAQTDFDSGLATKTTDNLTEGATNLYYTQSRAQTDFDSGLATKTTDNLTEGTTNLYYSVARSDSDFDKNLDSASTDKLSEGSTNLYYTKDRWDSALDSAISAGKISAAISGLNNTDSLPEGSTNLYYTQARAQTDFDSGLATKTTDNLAEGSTNLYYTQSRAQTDFDSGLATKTTSDLAEGTNLYYTTARADSDAKHAISATAPVAYDENTGVISIPAGNLGVLTLNGQAFDPLADSDKSFTFSARALNNTDSLAEGTTNLYYTKSRFDSDFNAKDLTLNIDVNSTDSVPEGTTNLYYTTARADSDAKSALTAGTGVTYDSATGRISIGQPVATTDSVQFANLNVSGNLVVQGTTTTVNTTNTTVSDQILGLAEGAAGAPTGDAGLIIERGTATNAFIGFDESEDKFRMGLTSNTADFSGDVSFVTTGTLLANLEGNVVGQVTDISNHTTDTLAEGTTNLYYTQARAQTDFDSGFATKTTTDLAEGTNLYYTTARADSDAKHAISATAPVAYDENTGVISIPSGNLGVLTINGQAFDALADSDKSISIISAGSLSNTDSLPEGSVNLYYTKTRSDSDFDRNLDSAIAAGKIQVDALNNTDSLAEGSVNLYYTQARAQTDFDSGFATKTTDNLTEGTTNLYYTQSRAQTDFDSGLATKTTTDLAEGTNLYYTTARADSDAKHAISATGPLAYDENTGVMSIPAGNLGVLTINGQAFDALADSDKSINIISAGSLSSTDSLPEGSTNLYYSSAKADSDARSALSVGLPLAYDSSTGKITIPAGNLGVLTINGKVYDPLLDSDKSISIVSAGSLNNTDSLPEGSTNLYYTQSRAQTDFDSGLATKTTDNLTEGTTNLYYTQSRAQTDFDSGLATKTTTDLAEGTNLYYTQARAQTDFDSGLATKTTDNLTEGATNLYYTQARAQTDFDSGLATKTTTNLTEGTNLYYTTSRADSDARSALSATGPLAYDSATGKFSIPAGALGVLTINGKAYDPLLDSDKSINIVSAGSLNSTDSLPEGSTNFYYTKARFDSDFNAKDLTLNIDVNSTDSVPEGTTNLYYTTARADSDAKHAISATAPVAYDENTGVISIPAGNLGVLTINGKVYDPLADSDRSINIVSAGSLNSTDSLPEGSTNFYYTVTRADSDFDKNLDSSSTDKLSEGTTNLYYTTARADSDAKHAISATAPVTYSSDTGIITIPSGNLGILTLNGVAFDPVLDSDRSFNFASRALNNTDSLPEGSTNFYYTKARFDSDFNAKDLTLNIDVNSTDSVPEGTTNLYYTTARADSDARSALSADAPLSYDSATGKFTIPAGNLGVLTINGQPYDPLLDSDKIVTITSETVTYGSAAPSVGGSEAAGDTFILTSDGTSSGTASALYIFNGTGWTQQLQVIDGSPDGGATDDF